MLIGESAAVSYEAAATIFVCGAGSAIAFGAGYGFGTFDVHYENRPLELPAVLTWAPRRDFNALGRVTRITTIEISHREK